jgi:hypothetical protein
MMMGSLMEAQKAVRRARRNHNITLGILVSVLFIGMVMVAAGISEHDTGMRDFDTGHNLRYSSCMTGSDWTDTGSDGVTRTGGDWVQMGVNMVNEAMVLLLGGALLIGYGLAGTIALAQR